MDQHSSRPLQRRLDATHTRQQSQPQFSADTRLNFELHLSAFLLSVSGVFIFSSFIDGLIYKFLDYKHMSLMHEIVSFTGLGALLICLFGLFDVQERKKLDARYYRLIQKKVVDETELKLVHKKLFLRYAYVGVGAFLYIAFANAALYVLAKFNVSL